jgi:hypothetical protein
MAPGSLASAIQSYLGLCLYSNATFLAERLYAEQPSEANQRLLAECYIRAGAIKRAHSTLQSATSPSNRYEPLDNPSHQQDLPQSHRQSHKRKSLGMRPRAQGRSLAWQVPAGVLLPGAGQAGRGRGGAASGRPRGAREGARTRQGRAATEREYFGDDDVLVEIRLLGRPEALDSEPSPRKSKEQLTHAYIA